MAGYSYEEPEDQTWVFPAAVAATSFSNSIWIPGWLEVIGVFAEALEATSSHLHLKICADDILTADSAATFADASDEAGNAITWVHATAAASMIFDVPLRGRTRLLLSAEDAAHAAVDQDGQVFTPIFRATARRAG